MIKKEADSEEKGAKIDSKQIEDPYLSRLMMNLKTQQRERKVPQNGCEGEG